MFKSGWSRLGLVVVILVELLIGGNLYHAKVELDEANERVANWTVPPPTVESKPLTRGDAMNRPTIEEIDRSITIRKDRMHYEMDIGAQETASENLKLFVIAIIVFPIVFAVFFYTLAWIVGGFRQQST